jgi:hypothetical protein
MVYARLRMRLTLRGFKQREGEQYDKYGTYAPVMHLGSLMLILILAVLFKLHIRMADDSKAFCEGIMDYKLYTTLPKPFNTMVTEGYAPYGYNGKDTVWLLISAIYGVKQAARQYFSEMIAHTTGPTMGMTQSQRDPCVIMRWFDRNEVEKHKVKSPSLQITAHETKSHTEMEGDLIYEEEESQTNEKPTTNNKVSFLLFGAWVDDKVIITCDIEMYENWFLPKMNERFITNDEGEPVMLLGIDIEYNKEKGEMKLSHHTSITRFLTKHSMEKITPSVVPCTKELAKEITDYKYVDSMMELQ